ncbi:DUF2332 family protein [Actinomycetospora sp.]|jgi:hypothetical protein|uniref:DUF2332 family protein n=1 Tax=Actinomycetospora sp. TaxID=1872135 RepID=UPI002F411E33
MPRTPADAETGTRRCAVLYPAVAEAAHRVVAKAVGLIDLGGSTGPNLQVDRVGIAYSNGQSLGDPSSPVQLSCSLVGERTVPTRAVPEVVARVGVDLDPVAVDVLPDAVARVPAHALPVVTTTWALSALPLEGRLRFLHRLDDAAAGRAVAWVSVEGVGVAPSIPTLGDRRASGHSIVGLAVFDGAALHAEAIGRCWSRGRWLAWLADS